MGADDLCQRIDHVPHGRYLKEYLDLLAGEVLIPLADMDDDMPMRPDLGEPQAIVDRPEKRCSSRGASRLVENILEFEDLSDHCMSESENENDFEVFMAELENALDGDAHSGDAIPEYEARSRSRSPRVLRSNRVGHTAWQVDVRGDGLCVFKHDS